MSLHLDEIIVNRLIIKLIHMKVGNALWLKSDPRQRRQSTQFRDCGTVVREDHEDLGRRRSRSESVRAAMMVP